MNWPDLACSTCPSASNTESAVSVATRRPSPSGIILETSPSMARICFFARVLPSKACFSIPLCVSRNSEPSCTSISSTQTLSDQTPDFLSPSAVSRITTPSPRTATKSVWPLRARAVISPGNAQRSLPNASNSDWPRAYQPASNSTDARSNGKCSTPQLNCSPLTTDTG